MVGMNTLQMIKMMPKFDVEIFVEWTRSLNSIMQIACLFLNKMISKFKRPEPILRGSREGKGNISDFDDNDSNVSDVSGHDPGSLNKKLKIVTTLRPGVQQLSTCLAF